MQISISAEQKLEKKYYCHNLQLKDYTVQKDNS